MSAMSLDWVRGSRFLAGWEPFSGKSLEGVSGLSALNDYR